MEAGWRDIIRDAFAADPRNPVAVYVFGSVARGTEMKHSDVDVAVLYSAPSPRKLADMPFDIEDDLSRRLGRPVQVVLLNRASSDVVHRVLRDGDLVLENDASARIRFEVKLRNQYFDMKPHRDLYRRMAG